MTDKRLTVDDLSPDQREVYESMLSWAISKPYAGLTLAKHDLLTVGGLAGTGKTTLLGVFAANIDLLVAYVTFTGRASSILARKLKAAGALTTDKMRPPDDRIMRSEKARQLYDPSLRSDSGPAFVGTIHRLLYKPVIDNKTEELLGWTKRDRLDRAYDLIVIDEASMVGGSMLEDLKRFRVPILAVGDHGQLPPVMDSGELMKNPDLRLEKIHRQALGSPIVQYAHSIRETGSIAFAVDCPNGEIRFARRNEIASVLAEGYQEWDEAADRPNEHGASIDVAYFKPAAPLNVGILCWTNRMRVRLNGMARQALGFRGPPRRDEAVIALRNAPPVYNGMRGILTADSVTGERPWLLEAPIEFPDEGLPSTPTLLNGAQFNREKTFSGLGELKERGIQVDSMKAAGSLFDFGYCLTGHKAQGSQFQHVILYVDRPVRPDDDDFRKWAYTCVTRASERLTVLL